MRTTWSAVLSGLILIALVAIGLAAFSPSSTPQATQSESIEPADGWSGRGAAAVLATPLQAVADPVEAVEVEPDQEPAGRSVQETSTTTSSTTSSTTTSTTQPTPTTTIAAPASTTSTTTTVPVTTSTAPPTTEAAVDDPYIGKADVERWRPLVATYFPTHVVEDALRVIDCESNGDPSIVNSSSGAAGLFQFLPGTWANVAPMAGWADADVLDPTANVAVAAWLSNYTVEKGQGPWQQWNCKP